MWLAQAVPLDRYRAVVVEGNDNRVEAGASVDDYKEGGIYHERSTHIRDNR